MAVYANYEFVANTRKSEEEGSYPLASQYERGRVSYSPFLSHVFELFYFFKVYY